MITATRCGPEVDHPYQQSGQHDRRTLISNTYSLARLSRKQRRSCGAVPKMIHSQ